MPESVHQPRCITIPSGPVASWVFRGAGVLLVGVLTSAVTFAYSQSTELTALQQEVKSLSLTQQSESKRLAVDINYVKTRIDQVFDHLVANRPG